jgi:RepB DNA-primase from phage plasmid/CHC2 zinc finger
MNCNPTEPDGAAEIYLRMLRAFAPPHTLLDVRYRIPGRDLARFFIGIHATAAASTIMRIGRRTDVYVGVAPRVRRSGRREDIAPTPLLWADCDGPTAVEALLSFRPPASMIVTSGSGEEHAHKNAHAYWALTRSLSMQELEDANRRLAAALGADPKCADAARILRVPGTLNFKHRPPRLVELRQYSGVRYRPVEILTALPPTPTPPAPNDRRHTHSPGDTGDPLLAIEPAHYVRVLTGRQPARDGKIHCPFHAEKTPSFHVYPSPGRGWTCFGCASPSGTPLGGDIYTLASLLWGIPASGHEFLKLRARLDAVFGVRRTPTGAAS